MYRNLIDYNDQNNKSLSNEKIREAIHKFIEEESISDANNVTADTLSHTFNTQRKNANVIFISDTIDNRTSWQTR